MAGTRATTVSESAFLHAVSAGSPALVYYLYGDDDFRKDAAVARALAAAVPAAMRPFNVDVRRGTDLDAASVDTLLSTPPLLAERRAVAIRDIGALRKDARRALDAYLERPAKDTLLLLIASAGTKPDRTLLDRVTSVDFQPLTGEDVLQWITRQTVDLGATITPEAAALLERTFDADLAQLASEIDKLVSYTQGSDVDNRQSLAIDPDAVDAVVGVRAGQTLGDLLDRIAERDVTAALALIDPVLSQPKSGAVPVIMALTVQTLALAWGVALRDQGVPPARIENGYFKEFLGGAGSVMTGRSWSEAVRAWMRSLDRWSLPALDQALDRLLAADVAIKDTRVSTDEQIISTLVLEICALDPHAHARAA